MAYSWRNSVPVTGVCRAIRLPLCKIFENHPRSVLVLPPFNESTAVDAPLLFNTTVSQPFGEKGYYVFPVFLTKDVLIDMGLSDEGLLKETPLQTFKDVFGADAVLYITVKEWVTTYLAIVSSVTVEAVTSWLIRRRKKYYGTERSVSLRKVVVQVSGHSSVPP